MSRKQLIGLIVMILIVGAFAAVIWRLNGVLGLLQNQTQEIVLALIMAIIAGFIIEYIYKKLSPQSKMLKTTQTQCSDNSETVAKLILPNNSFIIVNGEKILGREDFLGVIPSDELYFIGRDHFKITMKDCNFFIQDLKTKNGTTVNGIELQGSQKYKLIDGDEIIVAQSLHIKYKLVDV
jgi:hypothetical protein